ncbi:MAG: DHH family phosphoesterase [Patescibacteria group bacterium]|jgi:hypothetical protein
MAIFSNLQVNLKKGVIIHHWDTDGLVSAALLLNYFQQQYPEKKVELFTPVFGNYYLTTEQYDYLQQQGYQFVITCDINFPAETITQLAKLFPEQIYVIDHHRKTDYSGAQYFHENIPACAALITKLLNLSNNLLMVLGLVGDKEELIQADKIYYPIVQEVMADYNLTFTQLLELRRLIDSNYITNDYVGMLETIALLQTDPLSLLNDVRLQEHLVTINAEIQHLINKSVEQLSAKVKLLVVDTQLQVLSQVTRHLSRQYPADIIFTYQVTAAQVNCYVRRRNSTVAVSSLIDWAHDLNLNAGGKPEVVGIIVPLAHWATILPKLQAKLLTLTA